MARQKEFLPEQALQKAMDLFWDQGYERSSIEDLVQCTGLGRGSLYDTFRDKHSLYLAALDRYQASGQAELIALPLQSRPFREILQDFFQARIEEDLIDPTHRGCFMINAAIEIAPHDPEVARLVQSGLGDTEEAFYRVLIKAQVSGELSWTCDPHQLAHFLLNTLVGLRLLARSNPDRQMLQNTVKLALSVCK
jgi:TetR/AcrR family transcriptional regulator, transcriptional repressor for nem operon